MPARTRSQPTADARLAIAERDEAGNVVATYIHSCSGPPRVGKRAAEEEQQRVDVVWPENPKSLSRQVLDVFLPAGYPGSVTEDYLWYQIYLNGATILKDSLQAFSSSIAGLLSSRAVLEGIGVGNAESTPTNALYLSIIQESVGRIATILFAHRFGTMIEPECKMYRLLADVFNDAAMVLDCLSPAFPRAARVGVLGASSMLRALCGVAAGSAKGCLSAHFATCGNLGEVNAKDSSQETVISLLGMLVGSMVISRIASPAATWLSLLVLLAIHLCMNYLAVRAVRMRSFNQQRASIVFSILADTGRVPGPLEISQHEYVFAQTGVLRWHGAGRLGHCSIGAPLQEILRQLAQRQVAHATSFTAFDISVPRLLAVFAAEHYVLWYCADTRKATIVLKTEARPIDQVKAWAHALLAARHTGNKSRASAEDTKPTTELGGFATLEATYKEVCRLFQRHTADLEQAGWDLGASSLETRSGVRITLNVS